MNNYEEKTIHSKSIYEGSIISLRVDEVELPDGNRATRELINHSGAVAIIPVTKDGKLVLVRQYRKALERTIIEIPAGRIEKGEDPRETAKRELEEETGYAAGTLKFIQAFATSPGFANEIIYLYLAEQLTEIENPAAGDEDEFIDVLEITIEEAEGLVETGEIYDAKTAFALLYVKNK